ncbi:siderophore ABC transporter substrate-binding protein [Intestinibacter sp.]|uniref:siderophore ABC transporter substrate-binding protein n=1 Tax=Intestinibacter sp. TaxID=1965304 RepID=UPI002A74DBEA|nr:ABC transporter substrate-binding protein [Intestinibacter sp.]MDY2735789.1 ABC transporter substrate-binding protein [Intestinibacter sp.]
MKKRLLTLLLGIVMMFSVVGCSQSQSSESSKSEEKSTVTIKSLNGNKEEIDLEVPYDPQRIAVLDLAALDILDNLGVGDRVVGSADTSIDYLSSYADNDKITNLGTIKEADLEAVMECEPDVIFIGGRLAESYDKLSEIAPVVYLSTDTEVGVVQSVTDNATTIASMFGLESKVEEKLAGFAARIEELSKVADGKTALVGMTTSGSFNLLGNDGRCSIIGNEIGFENLTTESTAEGGGSEKGGKGESGKTSSHGNEASFETVLEKNPDYIFVMDRDSAIGAEGAQLAKEIMENELVEETDAHANGNIVYLENPVVWYTAEGGITALDVMLSDLESALLK